MNIRQLDHNVTRTKGLKVGKYYYMHGKCNRIHQGKIQETPFNGTFVWQIMKIGDNVMEVYCPNAGLVYTISRYRDIRFEEYKGKAFSS